ncbi:MAG: hypothetical protein WC565_06815 [Parcubacteria group bacterium]|jgi:hypothetical protein
MLRWKLLFRLIVTWLSISACFVYGVMSCAGTPSVHVDNPTELCATAVALSSAVKAQAAKLGIEPIELARRTCDAAILATQVAEANLQKAEGTAGATSSPSMAAAGAAGAAGSGG